MGNATGGTGEWGYQEDDKLHPDEHRLGRIERKLDQLGEGMLQLVRMEERMVTLFGRMDRYDSKQESITVRVYELERVTMGRGIFFRWGDRVVTAFVGAAVVVVVGRIAGMI
jgi:hypothetical protein